MRVVLLSDDYLPSSTRIHAKMLHELGKEFLKRGNKVVVITPGDWLQVNNLVVDSIDGIEVWRFRSKPTRGVGKVRRAINESLLSWRAHKAIKSKLKESSFDICINYSPTIFFGPLAYMLKKKGTYIYLVLRDFFPQWIIDEGIVSKNSLIARYFRFFERFNYFISDCVAVQSPANLGLFEKLYSSHPNLRVLMNWSESTPLVKTDFSIRKKLGLDGKTIFFYGGNIGPAQDMMNIMRLARGLEILKQAHLLLVGQGEEFELVEKTLQDWNLSNVTLLPSVPQEEYSRIVADIDVGLFSLSAKHFAHNFPGKLLGYMVESLPILGSVNLGNDVIEVINQTKSGFVSVNGQDDIFLANAISLLSSTDLRIFMGANSNKLLHTTFSVKSAADEIISQADLNL